MSIKLNCLACGHSFTLGDAYEDYCGEVRCWGCQAVMEIALAEGKLRAMRQAGAGGAAITAPSIVQPSDAPMPLPPDGDVRHGE